MADSQVSEYKTAIYLLSQIDAPLKLVIAGNHDFTLDTPTYQRMLHKARRRRNFSELLRTHGQPRDARRLFEHATGIHYLDEGTYRFRLANSTALAVHASPYTPAYGTSGFQDPAARPGPGSGKEGGRGHEFAVPEDADVVITHGLPRVVYGRRAGFGHIHEGWGAEVVPWGEPPELEKEERRGGSGSQRGGSGSGSGSTVIADLGSVSPLKGDSPEVVAEKERRLREYAAGKCVRTSHCAGDALPVEKGENTLFVNAAVAGQPVQPARTTSLIQLSITATS
ncbi:hypothetical protein MYCTH_2116377 [Thermothelomyces thermophilus ATCC 42464]|uniref:Calcineurin-like phosphoesterase domain-containing protein n=1 Tax=Thermothelomyces thermophilus (strain ATCC 42464 / BCRC 31852 / DSM 1799) TaxID=573729 RepID=G2PZI5_THET4|nr:uncharacterized protein MYCTH_2116377 [Thermothelomyces thermophilus ATCC 42464]AEO55671.1 hypothetical protein MYCTH_2116377 [Thermothelomyces thermophilus ATCC 42464]